MTPGEQADAVIAFYKRLSDGGVPEDAASLCSIDFNKSLMSGIVKPEPPDPHDQRAAIAEAGEAKRAQRAERLAAQNGAT